MTKCTNTGKFGVFSFTVLAILLKGTTAECPQLPNCDSCSDGSHCDACTNAGEYGLNADQTRCERCPDISDGTCGQCTSLSHCDSCITYNTGPVLDSDTAMCALCADGCANECYVNGAGKCDDGKCGDGYTSNADKTCSVCTVENCLLCPEDKCSTCKDSHWLDTTTTPESCAPCGSNCNYCDKNRGQCDPGYCNPGYSFQADSKTCVSE